MGAMLSAFFSAVRLSLLLRGTMLSSSLLAMRTENRRTKHFNQCGWSTTSKTAVKPCSPSSVQQTKPKDECSCVMFTTCLSYKVAQIE